MDAYRAVDNAHDDEAEADYEQECFVVSFTKEMLEDGEVYYDGYSWSIQGDIIPGLDSDVVAEFVAGIYALDDQEILDQNWHKMNNLIIDASNKLAVELWQGRNEA